MVITKRDFEDNNIVDLTVQIVNLETKIGEMRESLAFYSAGFWIFLAVSIVLGIFLIWR